MTPKAETESRYGIKAPAECPDHAVALPPPEHSDGGLTKETIHDLAVQCAMRSLLDLKQWRQLVKDYKAFGITPPPPGPPAPRIFHLLQSKNDGEVLVPQETYTHGIPDSYEFQSDLWPWCWETLNSQAV